MAQFRKKQILKFYQENCEDLDDISDSLESSITNIKISEAHLKDLRKISTLHDEIEELVGLLNQYQDESRQHATKQNITEIRTLCDNIIKRYSITKVKPKHVKSSQTDVEEIKIKKEAVNKFTVDLNSLLERINALHSKKVSKLRETEMVMKDWRDASPDAASPDAASSDVIRVKVQYDDFDDDDFDDFM